MPRERPIDHPSIVVQNLARTASEFETLGFSLTPRASHIDSMGTSNRLIQFAEQAFIEILEVDRPDTVVPHAFDTTPPTFSFGAQHKDCLRNGGGISMLAFSSEDVEADLEELDAAGLEIYAPFDFERLARIPDGTQVTVGFRLGFVTSSQLPGLVFFLCQQRAPEHFWKPEFQTHRNGARSIDAVYIAAQDPENSADVLAKITRGMAERIEGGVRVVAGRQELIMLTPSRLSEIAPMHQSAQDSLSRFAGMVISVAGVPAERFARAGPLFIEWRPI